MNREYYIYEKYYPAVRNTNIHPLIKYYGLEWRTISGWYSVFYYRNFKTVMN